MRNKRIRTVLTVILATSMLVGLFTPQIAHAQAAGSLSYLVVSVSTLPQMKSGETGTVKVVLKNTGTSIWTNTGANAVKVGTAAPFDSLSSFDNPNWLSANRVAVAVEPSVANGQTAEFDLPITAGGKSGKITEKFGLVMEGVAWAPATFPITLDIAPANYSASLSGPASVDLELKAGEVKELVSSFTNTGTGVWQNIGASATRLGTTGPFDRKSQLATNAWLAPNRVANITAITPGGGVATVTWAILKKAEIMNTG